MNQLRPHLCRWRSHESEAALCAAQNAAALQRHAADWFMALQIVPRSNGSFGDVARIGTRVFDAEAACLMSFFLICDCKNLHGVRWFKLSFLV